MASPTIFKVLHTAELLESILLHLDPQTLLLSQRVSQNFHQTIQTSPRLLQTLYLKPSTHPEPTLNPLFHQNRLVRFHHSHIESLIRLGSSTISLNLLPNVHLRARAETVRPSWRDMFALSRLEAGVRFSVFRDHGEAQLDVFFGGNPTLGELVELGAEGHCGTLRILEGGGRRYWDGE